MYELILVRYGEMTLKKKNYKQFLDKITKTIRFKLSDYNLEFKQTDYRFYIYLNDVNYLDVVKVLQTIPGIHSYSLCKKCLANYDDITKVSLELLDGITDKTFKIETNRANKDFPANSIQISQEISKRILPKLSLKVDVRNPQITLHIDLRSEGCFLYLNSYDGLKGYPQGIAGNGLLLISGGIDSVVAGFLCLKKGVNLTAIHFASPPHTSINSLQKVIDLVQILSSYDNKYQIDLLVVPFTKIQERIMEKAKRDYLVCLMRRSMYKIADRIAKRDDYDVIINGESIGQVASQTLESIKVVNEVTNIPIIRPLATLDKEDIIEIARKIDSYETSIKPYEDCCTVFVPAHPVIKPNIEKVLIEENRCMLEDLIIDAINNIEVIKLNAKTKYNLLKTDIF